MALAELAKSSGKIPSSPTLIQATSERANSHLVISEGPVSMGLFFLSFDSFLPDQADDFDRFCRAFHSERGIAIVTETHFGSDKVRGQQTSIDDGHDDFLARMKINRLLMKLPIDERPQVLIFPAGIEQSAALEAVMQTLPELEDLERECQVYAHERHKDAHALNHITKWQHDRDS
eukprot:CAMPEP_0173086994 /NCGR_PEP_ID=MMETSP1102-20130122/23389_1 /TAXON_ID=49646 /ORGANISM="Geminigera sp., Strain Caron Lab Isolate" /LENGTH=175 /DNA_ID=CAMNT_0013968251 /DNA_START=259 /DNA_END=786 /DNA_ORIENTATION=-